MMRITEGVKQSLMSKYQTKGLDRITGHQKKPSASSSLCNSAARSRGPGITPYSRPMKAGGMAERRCNDIMIGDEFNTKTCNPLQLNKQSFSSITPANGNHSRNGGMVAS